MNKDRPIPIDEALTIARQIADALEAAHEKGIIHRDLKPSNIMLSAGDRVKVLDFGLAKAGWTGQTGEAGGAGEDVTHSPTVTVGGTREGVILGTAAYMSPEQARGKVVDKRTDIWAFGCVLYELLTGRKAFAGDTVSDVIAAILDREPDWSALPKTIPSTVRRLLQRCLEKDLKRRLRDIGDAQLELDDRADAEVSSSPSPPALPLRIALWTLSGLIVGGLLVGLGIRFVPRATPDEVTRFAIALPPDLQLDLMALSPDGRVLVYAGSDSAGRRLYKRTLDTLESVAIRGTEGGAHPFFSPDGASVGFFARDGLKRIPLEGGLPTTISATTWSVEEGAAGTWLSDDTIVFESQSPNRGLERIPASGGEATHLTVIDKERGEVRHMWPVTVPGERALLFTVYSGARDSLRIDVVSLQSGERTALVQGSGAHVLPTGHIAFGRGGSLWVAPFDVDRLKLMGPPTAVIEGITVGLGWRPIIAVGAEGSLAYVTGASDPYPPRTLVWVDRTGREEPVDTPARAWFWPQISPDGRRLGGHIHDPVNMDAWIYELDHGPLVRMTYDARQNGTPLWSPDGTRVAFWSRQGGPRNLYLRPADLSGRPERLTTSPNDQAPLSWSGDGRLLVFHERSPDTGMDIGVVSIDGDHKSQVIIRGAFNEGRPAVSPDGRWIAYESNASGRSEVYVQPFPGLETRWQVSTEGGESPSWGPDGRELFCRRENAMIRVPVRTTGNSFRYGNSEVLFEGPYVPEEDAVGARSYAVAPDGRRFLMMKEQERHDHDGGASQIVVIRNWVSELERRAPTR
jgi:serine/threonine-protein kinase